MFHFMFWLVLIRSSSTSVPLCLQSVSSHSVSLAVSSSGPPDNLSLAAGGIGGFPVFGEGYSSALSHMEEGVFEQEEGKAEVTCI